MVHSVCGLVGHDVMGEVVGGQGLLCTDTLGNLVHTGAKHVVDVALHHQGALAADALGVHRVHVVRAGVHLAEAHLVILHKGCPQRLHVALQRWVVQSLRAPVVGQEEALKAGQCEAVQHLLGHAEEVRQLVEADQVHLVAGEGPEAHGAHQAQHGQRVAHKVHQLLQEPHHVDHRHGQARHAQQICCDGLLLRHRYQNGTHRMEDLHCLGRKGRDGKLPEGGKECGSSQRCLRDGVAPRIPPLPSSGFNFFRVIGQPEQDILNHLVR